MEESTTIAFLPEGWADFEVLLDAIVPVAAGLYRWEEWSIEDGRRQRAAHFVPSVGGPGIEAIGAEIVAGARGRGFRLERREGTRTTLVEGDSTLRVGFLPLPPQVVLDLQDRMTTRGAAQYPAIAEMFRLVAAAGAARFLRLHRFAELDLEFEDRFYPPTTEMITSGAYDRLALCAALADAGFFEDGDTWLREAPVIRTEVRLRDETVEVSWLPRHLVR